MIKMENTEAKSKIEFNIYRFKIEVELLELLKRFTIQHQFENRKDFKESWNKWKEIHTEEINKEKERMKLLNYKGDVEEKLYKAVRYYFRNKFSIIKEESNYVKAENKIREYITLQSEFLNKIDNHIKDNIANPEFSPATGYDNFCKTNITIIKEEIENLLSEKSDLKSEFIRQKIKKAYKNRYYQFKKYN